MPRLDANRLLPIIVIGLPITIAILYYGFFAESHYSVESKVLIKDADQSFASAGVGGIGGLSSLLGKSGIPSPGDELYLKEYILSLDMLDNLERDLKVKEEFSKPKQDIFYRLSKNATQEKFLEYYRSRVNVYVDPMSLVMSITTEGFSPEFCQKLNKAILVESERFINDISHRIAQEQMDFSTQQVEKNLSRLIAARDEMMIFQNQYGVFDPVSQAGGFSTMIMGMQANQAQMEADLRNLQTYMNDDSPQVITAKNAIKSLQTQIAIEKAKVAAPGDNKMSEVALKFLQVKGVVEFSTDLYKMSLSDLEKTRIDAARKIKNLVVLASPHLPERSDWQRQLLNFVTLLIVTILLYGLIKLTWAVIEDHRE
jgi:capsular polysaccharide transport system permease protein